MRLGRRLWRDNVHEWLILLGQFWWPVAAYVTCSLAAAMLFWRYYPETIGFEDAFLAVVLLTVFETLLPIPQGGAHWLIILYFLMPLVGVILAGQGLGSFFIMMFNRRERGGAWFEAVAKTFRGHVVVCGLGHVGSRVVVSLMEAGSDVVGVEQAVSSSTLERVRNLKIPIIEGDIKNHEVLRKAGVDRARAVVICTDNDLANLQAAIHCREINPSVRLIMRLFDAELARHVKDVLHIDEAYSASALAAPFFAGAALDVDVDRTFSLGDEVMSVGRLTIHGGGKLEGYSINEIENRFDCSVVAHERAGRRDWHPDNSLVLSADDQLIVVADLPSLNSLASSNRGRDE